MFYENYCTLCRRQGLTPSGAATRMGINRSSVTFWKKTGKAPKQDILLRIADFFKVSVDYLLTGESNSDVLDQQLEGLEFALFGEVRDMTNEQKRDVLNFARFIKQKGE